MPLKPRIQIIPADRVSKEITVRSVRPWQTCTNTRGLTKSLLVTQTSFCGVSASVVSNVKLILKCPPVQPIWRFLHASCTQVLQINHSEACHGVLNKSKPIRSGRLGHQHKLCRRRRSGRRLCLALVIALSTTQPLYDFRAVNTNTHVGLRG